MTNGGAFCARTITIGTCPETTRSKRPDVQWETRFFRTRFQALQLNARASFLARFKRERSDWFHLSRNAVPNERLIRCTETGSKHSLEIHRVVNNNKKERVRTSVALARERQGSRTYHNGHRRGAGVDTTRHRRAILTSLSLVLSLCAAVAVRAGEGRQWRCWESGYTCRRRSEHVKASRTQ